MESSRGSMTGAIAIARYRNLDLDWRPRNSVEVSAAGLPRD